LVLLVFHVFYWGGGGRIKSIEEGMKERREAVCTGGKSKEIRNSEN
jgi:hypothetical protein